MKSLKAGMPCVLAVVLLTSFGCSGSEGGKDGGDGDSGTVGTMEINGREGCAHLLSETCIYPYPSMAHLKKDETSETGWRVDLTRQMLPFREQTQGSFDYFLSRFNAADGFSPATPILALFPGVHVDGNTLPQISDLAASVLPGSSVQILDRKTGERLPVWAEMDNYASDGKGGWNDRRRSMIIRPQKALAWNSRYAVVITKGAKDGGGVPLAPPPAMKALLDGIPTDSAQIESMRADYETLFTFLAGKGVARDSVVLAWEFHTMSRAFAEAPLRAAVEEGRKLLSSPVVYDYDCQAADTADQAVLGCAGDANINALLWRRLEGKYETPSFIGSNGYIEWIDGKPAQKGTRSVTFVASLPVSVKDAVHGTVPIIQIGHGLMSSMWRYLMIEGDENGVLNMANKIGAFSVGADFSGLCTNDIPALMGMIEDFSTMWTLHDRVVQGMVDINLLVPFVLSALKNDQALMSKDGASLLDPARIYYYGVSLGGMMGVAHAALSPEIKDFVFDVPSAMFSSIFQHSAEFKAFQNLIEISHPDPVEQQILLAFAQRALDPIEPVNWIGRLFSETLTALGRKNALWQIARNDCNAPDFGAYALQRSAGIPLVVPTTHEVYGVTESITAPSVAGTSGLVIYDTGRAEPSYNNADVPDNGAHFTLRCNDEVHRQVQDYFTAGSEGTIALHCGGGACFMDGIECRTGSAK